MHEVLKGAVMHLLFFPFFPVFSPHNPFTYLCTAIMEIDRYWMCMCILPGCYGRLTDLRYNQEEWL